MRARDKVQHQSPKPREQRAEYPLNHNALAIQRFILLYSIFYTTLCEVHNIIYYISRDILAFFFLNNLLLLFLEYLQK